MSQQDGKRVVIEVTESQQLRQEIAALKWEVNYEKRLRLDAERSQFEALQHMHYLASEVSKGALLYIDEQRAQAEAETMQLAKAGLALSEQIKTENGWGSNVEWDAATLTFSAPAEDVLASPAVEGTESKPKFRIQ